MAEAKVIIHKSAIGRLTSGHSWIFRGEVVDSGKAHPGDIVRVHDVGGVFRGRAFFSDRSTIALRILTREDRPVDLSFWQQRLELSDAWRREIYPGEDVYRVLFSDGDFCSSIIVDRYGPYLVLQTLSQGAEQIQSVLIELLKEKFGPQAILLRNDAKVRQLEGLPLEKKVVYGNLPERIQLTLGKVRFEMDLLLSQKTGLFLDQRENYQATSRYAGGKVLDLFTYAGGFGLHAAVQSESVECVDISSTAIEDVTRNASLNGFGQVRTVCENAFDLLRAYDQKGNRFDTVILDPPAFAKNRQAVNQARKGYKEINLRAIRLLNPGGFLITCSCSNHITTPQFEEIVQSAAADAQRAVQWVESRGQARDHPWLLGMPETRYLKCLILRVW